jgi:hypothetical protein
MWLEVTNMDAVRMAQRLTEKEILFYYHLPVLVLICLKIMRIGNQFKQAVHNL